MATGPERIRRRRIGAALALLLAAALVAFGVRAVRDVVRGYDPRGAEVAHVTLRSRLLHRDLEQTLVTPAGGGEGRPLLVFLHGRTDTSDEGNDSNLSDELFAALRRLGDRAPAIAFLNGGASSYWHDRADGPWGRYVMQEAIPDAVRRLHADGRRIAIGGISMGGFGAYDLARLHPGRFCAVGGHSAALWERGGDTAPGAFDDAEDFARHDLLAAARTDPAAWRGTPLWLDGGDRDAFRTADDAFAAALRAGGADLRAHVWKGGHDSAYWRAHIGEYLRFYARALARCGR